MRRGGAGGGRGRRAAQRLAAALATVAGCCLLVRGALEASLSLAALPARNAPCLRHPGAAGKLPWRRRRPTCLGAAARVEPDIAELAYAYEEGEQDGEERSRVSIEDLEIGQQMNGIVSGVTSFGAFVDVGADHQGLVHIAQLSESYVLDINDHVQRGQMVKVWVLGLDDQGRLNLSMLNPDERTQEGPSDELAAFLDVGEDEWLEGTVSATTEFGIFVDAVPPGGGPSATGLVHVSQIKEGFVDHPSDEAEIGDKVRVRVVKAQGSRLSLSLRPPPPKKKPDFSRMISTFERLGPTDWIQGRVHHIVPFGAFVEVEPLEGDGVVMGLLHVTEMREGFVEDPALEVQLNQQIKVRVISVDASSGRLGLSLREPGDPEAADPEAGAAPA